MQRKKKVWLIHRGKKMTGNAHEEAQALHLLDRDFKSIVINMFKWLKETMIKELKGTRGTMFKQTEYQ